MDKKIITENKKLLRKLIDVLKIFEKEKISYLLIKPVPFFFNKVYIKNFDILLKDNNDFKKARKNLLELAFLIEISTLYEKDKEMYVKYYPDDNVVLRIHLHKKISWDDRISNIDSQSIFKEKEVFSILNHQIPFLSKEYQLIIYIAHAIFENKKLSKDEVSYLRKLFKEINKPPLEIFGEFWWRTDAIKISEKILKKKNKKPIKIYDLNLKEEPFLSKILFYKFLLRKKFRIITKLRNRACIYFSFSGLDGSGKTTLIKNLQLFLTKNNFTTHVYYLGWKKTKIDNLIKIKSKNKKEKIKENFIYQFIKTLYIFLKYFFLFLILKIKNFMKGKIILIDRFYYDHLIEENNFKWLKIFLLKFFPKPTISFYIFVRPKIAYKRKREIDLDALKFQYRNFEYIFNKFHCVVKINNEKTIKKTLSNIIKIIFPIIINRKRT